VIDTASWGRRILALFVDWIASTLVVVVIIGPQAWSTDRFAGFYVTGVFIAESAFLTALAGGSFGKLATRLRTVRNDTTYGVLTLLRAVLRQGLVALGIPPLGFRPDGRGLHALAAHSRTGDPAGLRGGVRFTA